MEFTNIKYKSTKNEKSNRKWDKVFKNGPSKICRRQLLKNLKGYSLPKADHIPSNF